MHPEQSYEPKTIKSVIHSGADGQFSEPDPRFQRGLEGRRRKAAATLFSIWVGIVILHLIPGGAWFVVGIAGLVGLYLLVILSRSVQSLKGENNCLTLSSTQANDNVPFVSILVAAKNEEAVIESLVFDLCNLQYPCNRYELWIVDDASSDRTPKLLDDLAEQYANLSILHRSENAGGGKSGALNDVLSLSKGEILGVFDADAQVDSGLLQAVVPQFNNEAIGAIQLRKATVNADENFWTRNQANEMLFDSYIQSHRVAVHGIGELRGNGQFIRRAALEQCDGWNEQTITDDLDLTLRLHLNKWDVCFLSDPVVGEEGVTTGIALWHQRSRWAEGGYQRYLDYWRLIIRNKLGTRKSLDLFVFMIVQYLVPTAAVPDVLMAIARNRLPILSPLTTVIFMCSFLFMIVSIGQMKFTQFTLSGHNRYGSEQTGAAQKPLIFDRFKASLDILWSSIQSTVYMVHWIPIVAVTTFRIAIRPKRLKWVKTAHHGRTE